MDYNNLTSPCGRDCFNCPFYLSKDSEGLKKRLSKKFDMKEEDVGCEGCRNIEGKCKLFHKLGISSQCKIFLCSQDKKVNFCFECKDFPCDLLHPLAFRADEFPHNMKVFNLCAIKKIGLENWAKNQAKDSFKKYYEGKFGF